MSKGKHQLNTSVCYEDGDCIVVESDGDFGTESNWFTQEDTSKMFMLNNSSNLMEMLRLVYLTGVNDQEEDCASWCEEGSTERVQELLEDLGWEGLI